MQDWWDFVT